MEKGVGSQCFKRKGKRFCFVILMANFNVQWVLIKLKRVLLVSLTFS